MGHNITIKQMSLQMFYSNIMAHMPSAYGLGKNTIFNKVQFSSEVRNGSWILLGAVAESSLTDR